MFAAYQIQNISFNSPENFIERGSSVEHSANQTVSKSIHQFVKPDGAVDAAAMMGNWFPEIEANIFISHARADKDLALALSGWLKSEFQLKPFIDSCVWSHANGLLRVLDDHYCKTGDKLFSYEKSIITASHVHMMLATALSKMMDRCECIFFLKSANSVSPKSVEQMVAGENESTHSPWLFHEISMMQMLRRRLKEEHREKSIQFSESIIKAAAAQLPQFDYPVNLDGLPALTVDNLHAWQSESKKQNIALDALYRISPPPNP